MRLKMGHAQDDNDAWYQARWGERGSDAEILIKRVGFWAGARRKYDPPSPSEKGVSPYTPDERAEIEAAHGVSKQHAIRVIKNLNGIE